jgi:hypothetical protein
MSRVRCRAGILLLIWVFVSGPVVGASYSTRTSYGVSSAFPLLPPEIDGIGGAGEWDDAGRGVLQDDGVSTRHA